MTRFELRGLSRSQFETGAFVRHLALVHFSCSCTHHAEIKRDNKFPTQ
jgi:hypothetical protein